MVGRKMGLMRGKTFLSQAGDGNVRKTTLYKGPDIVLWWKSSKKD
jgi:hypothetical protein